MAVDLDRVMHGTWFMKWMTVGKIKSLLSKIDDDNLCLYPNLVGNLTAFDGDEAVGCIDFVFEEYENYLEVKDNGEEIEHEAGPG